MYLTSTINPLSTSDGNVPLSIFCHRDEKRFLRVSERYEDTIERVVNSFRIRIRCDQTVLLQTSCFTACRGSPVMIDKDAYSLLWSILEEVEVIIATEPVDNAHSVDIDDPNDKRLSLPTSPKAGPSRDGLGGQMQDDHATPSPFNTSEDEWQQGDEVPTTPPKVLSKSDPLGQWDDEIQQVIKQERQTETPARPQEFKAAPISLQTGSETVSVIKKEKRREPDASASAKLDGIESPYKRAVRSVIDNDTRFEVVIVGPDEDYPTQFKLRGKNSVRKVLTAACKNFDIDPNQACLVHSMELHVDGEVQTHDFVCSPDDTIAMCGIKEGSKLSVRIDSVTGDTPE